MCLIWQPMQQNHGSDHLTPCHVLPVTPSAEAASPERIIADVFHRKKVAETAARPFSAVNPRNSLPIHDKPSKSRRRSSTDAGSAPLRNGSQQMSFVAANVYSIDRDALSPAGGTSAQVLPPPPSPPPPPLAPSRSCKITISSDCLCSCCVCSYVGIVRV